MSDLLVFDSGERLSDGIVFAMAPSTAHVYSRLRIRDFTHLSIEVALRMLPLSLIRTPDYPYGGLFIGSRLVMCTWAGFAADLLGSYSAHGQLNNNNNNGCIM